MPSIQRHKVPVPGSYWVQYQQLLAGEYPGDLRPESAEKRLASFLGAGIRTFLDLTDEEEPAEPGQQVPGYRPLLRSLADEERLSVTYARIPIVDREIPSVWTMRCILDVIDRSITDENPVYVHCWAGRGRTGTVVGCYLRRHGLSSADQVIDAIQDLRQGIPAEHHSSPHTPQQIKMVKQWEEGA